MRKLITLFFAITLLSHWVHAQNTRYVDEVFSGVQKVQNLIYSVNITVVTGSPVPDTLLVDFYLPEGDTCTSRPLAVVLPTGTFLPRGFIAPVGGKDDYANVQVAERLAKRGYVAASIEYRVGWNPLGTDITRRSTIINAAYRGIQDLYAFLRYVNKGVVEGGNPYNIDTSRVALFGIGTGAFVAFNAAVLQQDEIFIDKFRDPVTGAPYINTALVGDLHGVTQGAINIPNHVGYNDKFHFVFGLDGAVGDSSWMEDAGSVPLVAGGNVSHPTTPFGIDPITGQINCDLPVFAAGQFVVNVGGSICVAEKSNSLGINDPLNKVSYNDDVSNTLRNEPNTFGNEHLWAINQDGISTGPWEYWDSTFWKQVPHPFGGTIHSNAISTNPDMGFDKANRYIDTSLWFFAPRAFTALKLNEVVCNCENVVIDKSISMINDFECQQNYGFGAGNDRMMIMNNPDPDAANSSEKVGAYREIANDPWAALCVDFGGPVDLSLFNVFKVDVNGPATDIPFLLKLEGGSSPAYEVWVNSKSSGEWETLTADFSSQASANHTRLCVFPNGGQSSANEDTYLFDNFRLDKKIRYQEEVFTSVQKLTDHIYGVNITVVTGTPAPDTLRFDLYLPEGDTCNLRPLAVVLPTGTFLPRGFIAPTGGKDDYANQKVAEGLAKRGYVAASVEYRVGWNPLGTDITRRSTIINAAYRGIQDLYSFIRYMNMTVVDSNNLYGIDTSKVALFGIGTGAFVAFNAAVLQQEEIFIDKFRDPVTGTPYINTALVGDLHGLNAAAINIPNNVGYGDDFHFVFGLDGAVGDSSWMEDGASVPLVAGGNVSHPTTPFGIDPITGEINCDLPVFAAGQFVVNVGGSLCVIDKANSIGINNPLDRVEYDDPVSNALRANVNTFGNEHLWAITQEGISTGPWEYWDSTFWKQVPHPFGGTIHSNAISTNPDMGFDKADRYIDTSLLFFTPRAFTALRLNDVVCSCDEVVPDPTIFLFTDFECQHNFLFGSGSDRLTHLDNPDPDGNNKSEKVGAYLEGANDPWAALCISTGDSIDLTNFNIFKVDVNSPFADIPFLLKLEGGSSPGYEVWVNTDTSETWETLEADFSSQRCANHTRICIFPNGGVESPNEVNYYIDNLRLEESGLQCLVGTENPVIETLNISPNPTNDVVYIRHFSNAVQFRVMNSLGQQVSEVKANGREVVSIDMHNLYPGIYLVGAYNADGRLIGNARIMKN